MTDIRAFIAISLPPIILARLEQASGWLQEQLPRFPVRWVPVKNIHLTLKFLGNVPEQDLSVLQESLFLEASRHSSFEIALGQPGAFPSINKPRVIWVGITAPPDLKSLARGIDHETSRLGFASEDRPFSPHLTLGRVGRGVSATEIQRLAEAVKSLEIETSDRTRVSQIHLYRSDLQPAGAVYTRLYSAALG